MHIVSGAVLLYIASALSQGRRANALIGFGTVYTFVFVLTLLDARLFGFFEVPVNLPAHVLHLALAVLSAVVGWLAQQEQPDSGRG